MEIGDALRRREVELIHGRAATIGLILAGVGMGLTGVAALGLILVAMSVPPVWPDDSTRQSFAQWVEALQGAMILGGILFAVGVVVAAIVGASMLGRRGKRAPGGQPPRSPQPPQVPWVACGSCGFPNPSTAGLVACRTCAEPLSTV